MIDRRARAREFLIETLGRGDWTGALDDGLDTRMRERNMRLIELMAAGEVDGLIALTSPELIVTQPPELPGARTYRGPEGLIEAFIDWPSQWDETRIEPVRTWQAGPDVAITHTHQAVRAIETGLEFEADFWFVLKWADDELISWTMHGSLEDAERAAGSP